MLSSFLWKFQRKMDSLAFVLVSLCVSFFAAILIPTVLASRYRLRNGFPPGPLAFPIIGNLHWLYVPVSQMESLIRRLRRQYGPVVMLQLGSRPIILVSDREIAHEALVRNGTAFVGRPALFESDSIISNNGFAVKTVTYGSLWRCLRRNLKSEVLHPSRIRLFSEGRDWVLGLLLDDIRALAAEQEGIVTVLDPFRYAMVRLLVLMCFGERPGKDTIREIERIQREILLLFAKLQFLDFFPGISKYLFPERWRAVTELHRQQMDMFCPLIQARRDLRNETRLDSEKSCSESFVYSYVDSLLELELPEENGRKLTDKEIVGLCSEFLAVAADTTSTALQWIMARLVKDPLVQSKLYDEINSVVTKNQRKSNTIPIISEDDLPNMPYLKAVVLEGLRRHPPSHFILPHFTTQEISVGGYLFPKGVTVNFTSADMGWDEGLWKDPMEFRPERFLAGGEGHGVDITGSRGIKMMPFGAGRRICPGLGVSMLHLEYFLANLLGAFDWRRVDGDEVNLEEKLELTITMKHPIRARVIERPQ